MVGSLVIVLEVYFVVGVEVGGEGVDGIVVGGCVGIVIV